MCFHALVTMFLNYFNPSTPEDFYVFEWFSAYTRSIGFCDTIFGVTMESPAVLKH